VRASARTASGAFGCMLRLINGEQVVCFIL
jgi:hypothetical protein